MAHVQPTTLGLRGVKLLHGLPEQRLEAIAARCRWRTVPAGHFIVARNAADRDVHLVVHGRVRVTTYAAGGRQVTFRDEEAGEMFGDLAAIDGQPRSADVLALDSVLVATLAPEAFLQLVAEEDLVRDRVLRRLAQLVRSLSDRLLDLSTLCVPDRITAELLRMARQNGVHGNRARLAPAPRHADLACQVGTYREQVTRELSALARKGLLAREGDALVLLDVQQLAHMVDAARSADCH